MFARYHPMFLSNFTMQLRLFEGFNSEHKSLKVRIIIPDLRLDNYFASSDPHHDISKQLVDTTFV